MTENDLHQYQLQAVDHIISHTHCALFLDMGLGKTVSTLTAINELMFKEVEVRRVLVIAPKRVAESVWTQEVEKWDHLKHIKVSRIIGTERQRREALSKKADVYTIGRDNVAWLCGLYGGSCLPFDMVVIDELSSFKNPKSIRFKALKHVQASLSRVVGLTGTPAPNGLMDLWAQMYLLDRGERLGKDYLDLPERIDNIVEIQMPPEIQKAYDSFEEEQVLSMIDQLGDAVEIPAVNAAALSTKLLQFANGAVYDEHRVAHEVHTLKIEATKELIEDAGGQSVLIGWTFQHDRDRLMEALAKYKPRELKTEKDIVDWNAGKIQVLLMHPASGGHGLNLQAGGHRIIWFGQTYSLELEQQFNARLDRQGQKNVVIVNKLVCSKTVDQDVIRAQKAKTRGQDALMEAVKARVEKYLKKYRKTS